MSGIQKSILVVIFLLPFLICDIINYFSMPEPETIQSRETILIPRGATLQQIADTLAAYQLIRYKNVFISWTIALRYENKLQAGLFTVPHGLNYVQLIYYLSKPVPEELKVTLIEGWNIDDFAYKLERKLDINAARFIELCHDTAFIRELGLETNSLIGYLLPETYSFYWGMKEKELIKFLVGRTLKIFDDDSVKRQLAQKKMTVHQMLTLASIVEGEAILDEERPVIASVYYNRLAIGMRLQADPTIQFIIEGPPRRLLTRDLAVDSPYNTYLYSGLPPGPINNPGKESILASIYPAQTKYLYFVADGNGGHIFSRTNAEHARAKAEFDKIRRKVRLQKKLESQN